MKLLVRNLDRSTTKEELNVLFQEFGEVQSCNIVLDQKTGVSKGFGFVDMKASAARRAIAELDGSEFFGRTIKVSEANAQKIDE